MNNFMMISVGIAIIVIMRLTDSIYEQAKKTNDILQNIERLLELDKDSHEFR